MAVFRLEPRPTALDHPAWAMSWHSAPCHIVADSVEQARQFANCAFIVPLQSAAGPTQDLPPPWSDPRLVEAWRLPQMAEFGPIGTCSVGSLPQPERVDAIAA